MCTRLLRSLARSLQTSPTLLQRHAVSAFTSCQDPNKENVTMDAPAAKRCPHYQLYSEPLGLEGPASYLAIRRCLLAERLVTMLRQSEEGNQLADKLVVLASNGKSFAIIGPDLEAVTQRACTQSRCDAQCTPAYTQHLDRFDVVDVREDEVTCHEEDADSGGSGRETIETQDSPAGSSR